MLSTGLFCSSLIGFKSENEIFMWMMDHGNKGCLFLHYPYYYLQLKMTMTRATPYKQVPKIAVRGKFTVIDLDACILEVSVPPLVNIHHKACTVMYTQRVQVSWLCIPTSISLRQDVLQVPAKVTLTLSHVLPFQDVQKVGLIATRWNELGKQCLCGQFVH